MRLEFVSSQSEVELHLRPAESVEAFVSAPLGRYLSGPTFLRFCANPSLTGLVEWGRPEREHAANIVRALDADRSLGPHGFFHDARRLAPQQEPEAFQLSLDDMRSRLRSPLPITRTAVVITPGLAGSVVAGFYGMLSRKLHVKFFDANVAALAWLGMPRPEKLAEELDGLEQAVSGTPQILLRLRELMEARPPQSVALAARALGVSMRSLQRHLTRAATSFRDELNAARVRVAQRLLESSDLKITAIALEVGCGSSQHFSSMFRKAIGESPSAWRAGSRFAGKRAGAQAAG